MFRALIPSPPLSIALLVVWLVLNQSVHPATVLFGVLLAIVVPLITKGLRPATVRMRHPRTALRLLGIALHDLVASALTVAHRLLFRRTAELRPAFVQVPLRMRDPNGLAVLSMMLTLAPGTAWGELALDGSVLLIHVFDLADEAAFIAMVQQRYEKPLMEIFESS
ncbi:Na(+)/H(+) antiporter subunit E [Xylophilus ampelinus]|nr:Na+/H+ antiporter subunit E [Variovorax sp.]VTY38629.1 Na(+)/H(+) antiporter subunit E [Xylophilus ampelinus]|tara:strand:- start:432 stop:929 length:498 start_codon:yes stop_codon:yes gene_type:complete